MSPESNDSRGFFLSLLDKHQAWRGRCLNLVAAENAMSPLVRGLLSSDLAQRYGDYTGRDLKARRYFGTTVIADLEMEVARLAREVFRTRFVELRPISGHIAGNAVMMALCKPGDVIVELGPYEGGHRLATKLAASPMIDLDVRFFPFDDAAYNIDIERTLDLVRELRPRLVIAGASNFLFPVPLQELAEGLRDFPETILVYDASHVLGLIAGGQFQDPLNEGAQLVLAGTQKSFPGPQGAIIYTNAEQLIEAASGIVHPSMLSNHHLARLPSFGLALAEMQLWGADYAKQVIRNAQALAAALVEQDIPVVGVNGCYTESHTVLINTATLGANNELGQQLEAADIIVTATRLPKSMGGAGLRLGTNEVTRHGATEAHMPHVARAVADVLHKRRRVEEIREDVHRQAQELAGYVFTWPDAGASVTGERHETT